MKGELKDIPEKTLILYPETEEEERKLRELFSTNRVFIVSSQALIRDELGVTKFDSLVLKLEVKRK